MPESAELQPIRRALVSVYDKTGIARVLYTRPVIGAAIAIGAWTALLWVIEVLDQVTRSALEMFGIHAWQVSSLPSVFVAPLLHDDWAHLAANTIPFFVLGFLVLMGGLGRAGPCHPASPADQRAGAHGVGGGYAGVGVLPGTAVDPRGLGRAAAARRVQTGAAAH